MSVGQIAIGFTTGAGVAAVGVALSLNSITVKAMDVAAKFFSGAHKSLAQDIVLKGAGVLIAGSLTALGYEKLSSDYQLSFLAGSIAVLALDVAAFVAAHLLGVR